MDFPRSSKSVGSIFENIKEKISFQGRSEERDRYYDDDYYEDTEDFDNHADPIVSERRSSSYGSFASEASHKTRPARVSAHEQTSDYGYSQPAHLVSATAARSSAPNRASSPEHASYDAYTTGASSPSGYSSSYPNSQAAQATAAQRFRVSERETNTFIEGYDTPATGYSDFVSPYKERQLQREPHQDSQDALYSNVVNGSAYTDSAASSAGTGKQTGLDQLFTPTDSSESHNGLYPRNTARMVTTLRPVRYEEVESIAPAVKSGDILAIVLTLTNADLAKRVLDFTFGVASALDARVECVADNVFVVVRGADLTLEEKHELRKHGISL